MLRMTRVHAREQVAERDDARAPRRCTEMARKHEDPGAAQEPVQQPVQDERRLVPAEDETKRDDDRREGANLWLAERRQPAIGPRIPAQEVTGARMVGDEYESGKVLSVDVPDADGEIGRASCRERGKMSVVDV